MKLLKLKSGVIGACALAVGMGAMVVSGLRLTAAPPDAGGVVLGGNRIAIGLQANALGPAETLVSYDPVNPTVISTIGPLTGLSETQFGTGLAFTPDFTLWMTAVDINDLSSELHRLNPFTGGTLLSMPITGLGANEQATDLAYNPFTHSMNLLTASGNLVSVRELDLTTGNAVLVSPPLFSGNHLGLAITLDGHVYMENITSNTVLHYDASYNFLGSLLLPISAEFNQGMGADWSGDNTLYLAGFDTAAPPGDQAVSYTFLPDLSNLTFHGIIGGVGGFSEIADLTFVPDCSQVGCNDGNPCTDDLCSRGLCFFLPTFDGAPCEVDGNLCTIDLCDGRGNCETIFETTCQSTDPPCEGGQECNPATGLCDDLPDAPFLTICEADGDLCTLDVCTGTGGCQFLGNVQCPAGQACNPGTGLCESDGTCPWDCADGNGTVGINDFLGLLAQWGEVGTDCDFDGGGVGINDFLKLLANWGPC
jgi:hypothetical protein